MSFDAAEVKSELDSWFFDTYLGHWVDVASGERKEGPEFILQYWGTPMYVTVDDPDMAVWLTSDQEVIDFLVLQHELLREAGYTHTEVPDRRIRVYNRNGGAIEVIWSRRAADETEIQRYAVRFDVARMGDSWKVVGTQARKTCAERDEGSVDKAWL